MVRLFRIQHAEDFVGGVSRFVVVSRARIEWDRAAEKLSGRRPLIFGWQSVECLKQLARLAAHILSLDWLAWRDKPSQTRSITINAVLGRKMVRIPMPYRFSLVTGPPS